MTLEAWVYPTALSGGSTNGWRTVILKQQSTQLAYALYANSNTNRPNSYLYTSSDQGRFGNTQLPLNAWRHLAVTYDGAALKLYVSWTLVGNRTLPGSIKTSAIRSVSAGTASRGVFSRAASMRCASTIGP